MQAYIHCNQCGKLIEAEKTHNGIAACWLGHCCGFGQDAAIGSETYDSRGKGGGIMKGVRIKYWQQDTIDTGHWVLTGLMKENDAAKHVHMYDRGRIVDNDEEY